MESPRKPPRYPPKLKKGELIRLAPDGPIHTVVGVSAGSAQIKRGDWTTDEPGGVLGGLETNIDSISLHAFVYRVGKEDYGGPAEATEVSGVRGEDDPAGVAGQDVLGKV